MKLLNFKTLATGLAALLVMSGIFAGQALAVAAPPARIVVAKSGGNYTTITAALNAITPTAIKPYVIEIWPGVYTENVVLKSYVHLKGSGRGVTTIRSATATVDHVISANGLTNVDISSLTIKDGRYGIDNRGTTGTISENTISNNLVGISVYGAPPNSVIITGNNVLNNAWNGIEIQHTTLVATNNIVSGNGNGAGGG